jgi:hypothetical protein
MFVYNTQSLSEPGWIKQADLCAAQRRAALASLQEPGREVRVLQKDVSGDPSWPTV